MNHILYDLVVAALLLLALWQGYRKGFILTLCGFLAVFVAFIGATIISDALAAPVADILRPVVQQQIHRVVQEQVLSADLSAIVPPEGLGELLTALQDSTVFQGFAATFQKAVDAGVIQVTGDAVLALANYVAVQLAETVLFLVAFITILVVWYFISHALDLAFRLPVLSTLNHWAGALLGLIKGFVLLYIAAQLLKNGFLPPAAVEDTYLLRFFCTVNPLTLFAAISQ